MLFDFLGLYPYYGHKILAWLKVEGQDLSGFWGARICSGWGDPKP